jgi:LMBR1 domain-containing protein 1
LIEVRSSIDSRNIRPRASGPHITTPQGISRSETAPKQTPAMALIETSLIWVTYAICLAILVLISGIFIFVYQHPGERQPFVTIVCFITTLALLATILLQPVDIALTSSTVNRKLGRKKDWATPDATDSVVYQLTCVYYALYSLDAVLCLLVVPFTYFWYEEYDENAADEGRQSFGKRFWGAFKYTIGFLLLVVILFLVGFFVPVAKKARDEHRDLDYFKDLLTENRKLFSIAHFRVQG